MRETKRKNPGEKRGAAGETAPLWVLLRESLISAEDYSRKLLVGLDLIAEQFEAGDSASAFPNLSRALEGLSWLIGVYDRCRFFLAAPIRLDEETIVQTKLLDALKRLVSLAESGDFGGAAWITRQELLPRVETLAFRIVELAKLRVEPQ